MVDATRVKIWWDPRAGGYRWSALVGYATGAAQQRGLWSGTEGAPVAALTAAFRRTVTRGAGRRLAPWTIVTDDGDRFRVHEDEPDVRLYEGDVLYWFPADDARAGRGGGGFGGGGGGGALRP